ncbi:cytochrome c oxidase subunit II [Halomicroarcula sp. F13]|uniref:Cytochrome c oxidase subunit II n=1 Tax=Haloarcula rubra TaxID=2487747 RepID=A0AAW4PP41_9EURY|nr:cytochrome c oxidase subunit II [Halomicroarcula rubra]MBX0322911.1 cytochrome c oxidase subunit II [Halomicroarcula rubra]
MGHLVPHAVVGVPLHGGDVRAPADVFNSIFEVFLVLGTAVGVLVVTYTLYHAIKYRETAGEDPYADKVERPSMGEMPTGGSGGRKVFYSFGISAIIVVSLIAWTYSSLAYVEDGPTIEGEEDITVQVEGFRFGWAFIYPNGHETSTLKVPRNRVVRLEVTSRDVFHNFGIPELRVKTDAIPGQTTDAWFTTSETGTYQAKCYELCGSGHSVMVSPVEVLPQDEYQSWYAGTNGTENGSSNQTAASVGGAPA